MAGLLIRLPRNLPQKLLHNQQAALIPSGGFQKIYTSSKMLSSSQNPLDHYAKLPSLPVPKLEDTLQKYLWTVKPVLNQDELAITNKVVQNFGAPGGVGQKLQKMLEEKGSKSPNWLSEWWLDCAYLSYRLPVVVHSNPGLVCPRQNFLSQKDQLAYAAKLIVGALRYKADIYQAKLEQDYLGKSPLDMSQYTKIFGMCRIPGLKNDSLHQNPNSRHIVVAYNNHFFKLDVYTANGQIPEEADMFQSLLNIVNKVSGSSNEPVGILTTENRNAWGVAYEKLRKDPVNNASLQTIHDSILVLCLDKESRPSNGASQYSNMGRQVLYGSGSDSNSGNRWFDKTVQIIVGSDGVIGINYEHSPAEGPPIAALGDFILSYAKKSNELSGGEGVVLKSEILPFKLTSELKDTVELAKRNIDSLAQEVDLNIFTFDKFGKEDIKALKLSPDSFIQIAIQMAFIRVHGHPAAHYESASTRKFTGGRTETIRTCLPEVADFAHLHLKSPKELSPAKYNALQAAMKAHKDYVHMAINGQAVDRHLLGLKLLAIENGIDVPVLYLDPAFSKSNNWRCSTSQVSGNSDVVLCYGAVVPDGYGCCYNPRRDTINIAVSAFNSNPSTSAQKFREALEASLVDIRNIAASRLPSAM